MWFKRVIRYLGSFPKVLSENSTKLFALLLSAIAGFLLTAFIIPFCLIWDVITNGSIQTNLTDMGILVLSCGGLIAGAGFNIKVPDLKKKDERRKHHDEGEFGDE